MAQEYNVKFTDFVNKGSITIEPKEVSQETSLQLTGRNLTDYGEKINENFLHLLENFANNVSPSNPVEGQLWYDTTTGVDQLKIYDGANWVSAGGLKKASSSPAAEQSLVGDLWVDTSNQQLYLYSGSGWTLIGPDYAEGINTGVKFENIVDTTNIERPCLINYVNGKTISIISAVEFTPKLTIAGFGKIYPGHNVSNNIDGAVGKYWGTSQKAETLFVNNTVGSLGGAEFARLNATNIFSQPLRVRSNNGVDIGETQTLVLSVSGSNALITNKSNDGYIGLRVQNNTTAIRIKNDGKVGILNESPQEALDVSGNILVSGTIKNNSVTESTSVNTGSLVTAGGLGVAKNINVGGNAVIAGNIDAANILPDSTNTRNIGSSDLKYNNIWANNFRGNIVGDVIGNITGSAGSAAKLNSTTTFNITGDVATSAAVTFDGQTGGLTKTFNVTLNDTFFTGKPDYTDNISGTEEILIRKTTTESGDALDINRFYITTVQEITNTVPTFAVGMVMPYAGTTAPSGWLLCNGASLSTGIYSELFSVIGYAYGGSIGGNFNLPDLRGRFPLGYIAGESRDLASDEDRVYDDGAANILGADGGAQRRWITKDNLPEHEHSLMGDAGTQFYATTGVTGVTDSNTTGIATLGGTNGTGLEVTSGVDGLVTSTQTIDGTSEVVGEKFTTVPPYLTVNYIIYTGV